MAQSIDSSANWTSVPNSTVPLCGPCLYIFPPTCAAVLTSISLLGLPLEGWALWLLASSPITEKTDLLSFNLLFIDSLLHLTNLLVMSSIFLLRQSEYMWSFLLSLVAYGRPLFQCFISVERYMAVEHPTVFLKYRPLRYRVAILAPTWMSVLLICTISATLCAIQEDHDLQFLFFQCTELILIIGINSFCSLSILRELVRPPPGDGRRDVSGGKQNKKESLSHQIKKKAFLIVTMSLVFVVTCYLPPVALILSLSVLETRQFCFAYVLNLCCVLLMSCFFCLYNLHNMGKLNWINCLRKR